MHFRMASEPDWDLYRAFLAVLAEGSLSAAARRLGLAQPTVGRQIEALEAALGVTLFTRSPAGLTPTETALALAPQAETMAAAAQALVRTASGEADAVHGAVRLTASDIVGAEVLPPILAEFAQAWPRVEIELVLSNRQEDLLRRDADIAVRMAPPTQGALVSRKIGDVPLRLYAHRAYLARRGTPQTLADLADHTLIGPDRQPIPPEARRIAPFALDRVAFTVRTDNDLAQIAALRAGLGVCGCQSPIAAREPDLVAVLPDAFALSLPMYVVMHEDLKSSRRTRLLFAALVAGLKAFLGPPARS